MSDETLHFDLVGHDFRSDSKWLVRRMLPWWLRHGLWLSLLPLAAVEVAAIRAGQVGGAVPPFVALLGLLATGAGIYVVFRFRRERIWSAVASAPIRGGAMQALIGHEGLTVRNDAGHSFVRWSAIETVASRPGGLLIALGGMDHFVIPGSAFGTEAAKDDTILRINALIKEARG